jgi:hypothetical protein
LWIELSGWFGVIANTLTVLLTQHIFNRIGEPWMLSDDDRAFDRLQPNVLKQYGSERLTAKLINEVYLKDTVVPYSTTQNKVIGVLCVVISVISCMVLVFRQHF